MLKERQEFQVTYRAIKVTKFKIILTVLTGTHMKINTVKPSKIRL